MTDRNNESNVIINLRKWYFRILGFICILEMIFIIILSIIALIQNGFDVLHVLIVIASISIIIGLLFTYIFKKTGAVIMLVSSIGLGVGLILLGIGQILLLTIMIVIALIILPICLGLLYLLSKEI